MQSELVDEVAVDGCSKEKGANSPIKHSSKETMGAEDKLLICSTVTVQPLSISPEVFITDDNIVNTQESVGMEVDADGIVDEDRVAEETDNPAPTIPMMDQERRRSERLKKDTMLTTMEKN